jgi:hypothetical protein
MGLTTGKLIVISNPQPTPDETKLNISELVFLLNIVKQSTFVGEHVELVYNTVLKLQNQYLEQNK